MKQLFLTLIVTLFTVASFAQTPTKGTAPNPEPSFQPGQFDLYIVVTGTNLEEDCTGLFTFNPTSGESVQQFLNLDSYYENGDPTRRVYKIGVPFAFKGTITADIDNASGESGVGEIEGIFNKISVFMNVEATY